RPRALVGDALAFALELGGEGRDLLRAGGGAAFGLGGRRLGRVLGLAQLDALLAKALQQLLDFALPLATRVFGGLPGLGELGAELRELGLEPLVAGQRGVAFGAQG